MAIDENDVYTGVADPSPDARGTDTDVVDDHADMSLDELRLRLDSPLYAREPGLSAPVETPGLRELTWEHVTNPTTSQPVVPPVDGDGSPRPAPIKIEDLLARPAIALSPMEPIAPSAFTSGATEQVSGAAPVVAPTVQPMAPPSGEVPATVLPKPAPTASPSSLPSMAEMMAAAPVDPVPTGDLPSMYSSGEVPGVDELVKPIDEPPPVARDTDPLIAGLADLIVKSTPSTGMPRVEALRESLERGNSEIVPVIDGMSTDPPVLDAKVEFANASGVVPAVTASTPPPPPPPTMAPPSGAAAVQAEMNRLAFLPDQDDLPAGPVEVPEIAYSDVRGAEPVAPSVPSGPTLSGGETYQPRPSAAAVRHNYSELLNTTSVPVPQRRKRHVMRKFVSVVVLMALVAGGLFAVKYFVLDRVSWSKDLEPLAKAVEDTRKLEFEENVVVTPMPADEYATKLAGVALALGGEPAKTRDGVWRSLGLVNGALDAEAVGRTALVDSPAFYDPTDRVVYVIDDLKPEWRTYALHRALTMALLDQHFGWTARLEGAAPTVARGTVALYDGDAIAVADALLDDDTRAKVGEQAFTAYVDYDVPVSPSPLATALAGRLGLAVTPFLASMTPGQRDTLETGAAFTDGQLLDLRRVTSGAEASVTATSEGMLFWYHALASRIDTDLAWKAALAWQGDDVAGKVNGATFCTEATVRFSAASTDVVTAAFAAWTAASPEATKAAAQVGPAADGLVSVTVQACDPGKAATAGAPKARLSLGGAPLRAEQFRLLRRSAASATPTQVACAVYGADAVTQADERNMVDPVDGWAAPAAHPKGDPTKGACAKS